MNKYINKLFIGILLIFTFIFVFAGTSFAFSLTVNSDHGTVTKNPNQADYPDGTNVELTATPDTAYIFSHWEDNLGNNLGTTNPITITMDSNKTITAVYSEQYQLNTSTDYGEIEVTGTYPNLHLKAVANAGYEFDHWGGDVNFDINSQEGDILMDSNKSVTATFVEGKVTDFEIGPRHIVKEVDVRKFEFRPEARLEGYSNDVTILFQFSADAPNIYVINTSNDLLEADANSSTDIEYDESNGKVVFKNGFFSDMPINNTYEVRLGSQQGPTLATFTIKSSYASPRIDVRVENHFQYGILDPGKVYYLKNKSDLIVDVTAQSDIADQRFIRSSQDTEPDTLNRSISLDTTWRTIDGGSDIAGILNQRITKTNWQIDNITPFTEELNKLPAGTELNVIAVRMKASAFGAETPTDHTYYFALDVDDDPEVIGVTPGVSFKEILNQTTDSQKIEIVKANSAEYSQPEIKISFSENYSGFEGGSLTPEDLINTRGVKVDDDRVIDDIVNDYLYETDDQFDQVVDVHFRVIDYNENTKTATIFPYGTLKEGKYVIRVTATDISGNVNDTDTLTPGVTGFTFMLEVNENRPIINNITLKDNKDKQVDKVISTNGGKLYFDVHNSEEVRYQIRSGADVGQPWTYRYKTNLDKKTDYIEEDLASLISSLEDETYEVIIIADDIQISPDLISEIQSINLDSTNNDIEGDIKAQLESAGITLDEQRTQIKAFRFKVDGTAPQIISNIQYYNSKTTTIEDTSNGTFGVIYTAIPQFQLIISDISNITDLRHIEFVKEGESGGIAGELLNSLIPLTVDSIPTNISATMQTDIKNEIDQGKNVYLIKFRPKSSLADGIYNLQMDIQDEWGNGSGLINFLALFEYQNVVADIEFNINDGEKLSVNESSTIRIDFKENREIKLTSLTVKIDEKTIIEAGEQVTETKKDYYISKITNTQDGNEVVSRIIIFAKTPFLGGNHKVTVLAEDKYSELPAKELSFTVTPRKGFGFGRLLIY
ncbi:hypothetical protein U472_14785 [Orenia metallireducens]|uniref:Bacterial repeat domain-containing protein n=1 Tax=Orenia metallireducens TaxID=1413210 RepID=A0A1C0A656_9FIRM|nr:hypothetical protein [Orenia metallireducens]OCL25593.1 hypothetical protein U472_14785 [Orenia metallireducens]